QSDPVALRLTLCSEARRRARARLALQAGLFFDVTCIPIAEVARSLPESGGLVLVVGRAVAFLVHVGQVVAGLADAALAGLFTGCARQRRLGEDVVSGEVVGAEIGHVEAPVAPRARLLQREDGAGVLLVGGAGFLV